MDDSASYTEALKAWWKLNTTLLGEYPMVGLTVAVVLIAAGIWIHSMGVEAGKRQATVEQNGQA